MVNLCDVPLDDVLSVQHLSPDIWATSRKGIGGALKLRGTSDVLLAYGVSVPSGPHRGPYLAQLDWPKEALASESIRV
ncbi:hypothetical protein CH252_05050 [Rhodococcus sp. 06-1477-1B]|nr:hypothetical protein CH252_05050 [Rhodococcus sp. 06-1477-1B]